jgi:DNA-binding NarL/FixJ family response regulator
VSSAHVRVVVVEDEPDVRLLLEVALGASESVDVVGSFPDARSALAELRALDPNVIVLDLSMPGLSGIDALPLLRDATPKARIVVYSASDHPDIARAAAGAGADTYIVKARTSIADMVSRVCAMGASAHRNGQPSPG